MTLVVMPVSARRTESTVHRISILGSTGSIGVSALEVVRSHKDCFEISALSAGSNVALFAKQIREFRPRYAVLADQSKSADLKGLLGDHGTTELLFGQQAISEVAALPEVDVVLAAIVGFAGLKSVLSALEAGKRVALANKESLVCGAQLITAALKRGGQIIPVDSEHSAIFQALQGCDLREVISITLTASGGPFLNLPLDQLRFVKPEQALKHPNWSMGAKITIDSATMMNKALELIEACWLFGFQSEQVEVLVHPQSIIHGLVSFRDGTQLAQLSAPDMRAPIAYALGYPKLRSENVLAALDLSQVGKLEFFPLDSQRFPAVNLARAAYSSGGLDPAVLNLSNELAVNAFLNTRLSFDQIVPFVDSALGRYHGRCYESLEDLENFEQELRTDLQQNL